MSARRVEPGPFERRASGVLLHVTSLPGPYGGDLGPEARRFAERLAAAKQTWWQVLPVHPTDGVGSPYRSPSALAGNLALVSPVELARAGLLARDEIARARVGARPDPKRVERARERLLRAAFERFERRARSAAREAFDDWCWQQSAWLPDHGLFLALRAAHRAPWTRWPAKLRRRAPRALAEARRELARELRFHAFAQNVFQTQWDALRAHANALGVKLFGDLPLYVDLDSADAWAHPELFALDARGRPKREAGTPPDFFSSDGQRWGVPVFDWDAHAEERFAFWRRRIARELALFDALRLDHFLGFDRAWSFPVGRSARAQAGRYDPVPGKALFRALGRELRDGQPLPFAAEDLGDLGPGAAALRDELGLPGMRVLSFGFGGDPRTNPHLPHEYPRHSIAYTGTHDNDTVRGWFASLPRRTRARPGEATRERVLDYTGGRAADVHADLVAALFRSPASTAIVPAQDLLGLGTRARQNRPGTAFGNWRWRLAGRELERALERLSSLTESTGRAR